MENRNGGTRFLIRARIRAPRRSSFERQETARQREREMEIAREAGRFIARRPQRYANLIRKLRGG